MKRTAVFVFLACCAVSVLSLAEDNKRSKPSVTVSPAEAFNTDIPPTTKTTTTTTTETTTTTPKTTTTTTPKTTTTTPKPTTTTPKTTTTTPKTTTTTPKPTTTTPKPTTTTPKTTTTTPKPTTTTPKTTAPPPPQPTPTTNMTVGNYTLMKDGVICLMAQMELQIRLAIPKVNGTFIIQPNLTKTEGQCNDPKANLTLVFKEGNITFLFYKNTTDDSVYVDTLSFHLSYSFSKGAPNQYSATNKSVHLFAAKTKHSYSCKKELLYMGNGLYLDIYQDRMQAFNLTNNGFGRPVSCPADQPDYRVAIAVGVTLLVLIVIVVVAYLLSRRRRTDGYQSL